MSLRCYMNKQSVVLMEILGQKWTEKSINSYIYWYSINFDCQLVDLNLRKHKGQTVHVTYRFCPKKKRFTASMHSLELSCFRKETFYYFVLEPLTKLLFNNNNNKTGLEQVIYVVGVSRDPLEVDSPNPRNFILYNYW